MIDSLPQEIAANIAIHLSQDKIFTCICVSHSLYAAFIPTLYNNVVIKDSSQLGRFVDTLRSTETLSPLGHLVRELTLYNLRGVRELTPLTRLCPFVVKVNFDNFRWRSELFTVLQEWRCLTNIGQFFIHNLQDIPLDFFRNRITRLSTSFGLYPEWFDLLAELPCIEKLKLIRTTHSSGARRPAMSLHNLETIHNVLPRLQSLRMEYIEVSGEMPENITPCDTVCDLFLEVITGRSWGQYFAQKYTRVKKLNLVLVHQPDEWAKAEAMVLARSCRYLEHFEYGVNHADGTKRYSQFIEIFQEIRAPLIYLKLNFLDPSLFGETIGNFSKTLSTLSINTPKISSVREFVEALKFCSRLVDLSLLCQETDLELDYILESCKHLKNLNLLGRKIRAGDNNYTTNNQPSHGIDTLSLYGAMHDDVLPYISQHCPGLSSFDCNFRFNRGRSRVLYFACLNLDILKITFFKPDRGSTIYKVTKVDRADTILHCDTKYHAAIDNDQIKNQTRWYRSTTQWHATALQELELGEADMLSEKIPKAFSKGNIKKTQICISENDVIWVQYCNIDRIYLDGEHVHGDN